MRKVSVVSKFFGLFILLSDVSAHNHVGAAYMVPFRIDTYLPITTKNISTVASRTCHTTKSGLIIELILSAAFTTRVFDGYRVRARIDDDGKSIYVDQDGIFVHDERSYYLSESTILKILERHGCTN